MNITAQQARETTIFVIENGEIVPTTLYAHVRESATETTSPRGVMYKLFVDEIDKDTFEADGDYEGTVSAWQLREWTPNGKSRLIETYETEDEADNEWYDRTYCYDFLPDDQRDTSYYSTMEDAQMALEERLANV